MHKLLSGLLLVSLLPGCDQDSTNGDPDGSRSSFLPLVALDTEGQPLGLVGTFDAETQTVWLTDEVVGTAHDLAQSEGATDVQLIIRFEEDSLFMQGATAQLPDLEVGDSLRACAFDQTTETTWTIADVQVAQPEDLDALAAFIPTSLTVEEEPFPQA